MKVLFVCRQNVGRSQMAKAFYNTITRSDHASAAGTHVIEVGQTLQGRKVASTSKNFFVLDVMKDVGIDMSNYQRNALVQSDLVKFDLVVNMANENDVPEWLLESPKYMHWNIKDSRGQDYAFTAAVRDEVKSRVEALIASSTPK
jgi:arsenate reductase